ncbi:hypothetical protein JTE90_006905 [Oedothorax gibbosus]|uniref:Uncharacterized protein n=1 Tax=Oedothorax gibbosus TaxID=931172 RepID=A0AAV6VNL0_9ARAC|nr:hypothetical protein JTE90_006905 [Oedothorax gibbosus]
MVLHLLSYGLKHPGMWIGKTAVKFSLVGGGIRYTHPLLIPNKVDLTPPPFLLLTLSTPDVFRSGCSMRQLIPP